MLFHQAASAIVNFLPETQRFFCVIHLLAITRAPARTTRNIQPVNSPTVGERFPLTKFLLVLAAGTHKRYWRSRVNS